MDGESAHSSAPARPGWRPPKRRQKGVHGAAPPDKKDKPTADGAGAVVVVQQSKKGQGAPGGGRTELDVDKKGAGPRVRLRRRHGGGRAAPTKLGKGLDNGLKDMLACILRAVTQVERDSRDIKGLAFDSVLVGASSAVAKAVKEEAVAYGKAVREVPTSHGLGAPTATLFVGSLIALAEEDIGGNNKEKVGQELNMVKGLEEMDIECNVVKSFRLVKMHNSEVVRFQVAITDRDVRKVWFDAMLQVREAKLCTGAAPAGPLEDELGDWLDAILGKEQ